MNYLTSVAKSSTLLKVKVEPVPHRCTNGHVWMAAMFPRSGPSQYPWKYANHKDKRCPECGAEQEEEVGIF